MNRCLLVILGVFALTGCFEALDQDSPADDTTRGVIVGYIARRPVYRLTDAGLGNSCYAYEGEITCVRGRP